MNKIVELNQKELAVISGGISAEDTGRYVAVGAGSLGAAFAVRALPAGARAGAIVGFTAIATAIIYATTYVSGIVGSAIAKVIKG